MNQSRTLTATQTSTDALYAGTLFLRADGTTPDHTTQPPHHEQGQRSAARLREEEEARRIAEETVDPEGWPSLYGAPHYRPVNHFMDRENRGYSSRFGFAVLGGVWLAGVLRKAWRMAGEPGKEYWQYDVGGQY